MTARVGRRVLLKAGVGMAAGLMIGWDLPRGACRAGSAGAVFAPSIWLRIDGDAVFAATATRVRRLPVRADELRRS